ncbi:MAG: hypothetical protein Q7J98_10860 [Kiritimatiellia bacterium]|nr:hypothetical protein [Kiritimatiellia bacterium]
MTSENKRELELKSSAITLSDMEIFVFPELMYALLLANLMSPRIWEWRNAKWFDGLDKMKPYRRILRLKQYIMDHYAFNLDLDTWGLTTKEREISRFKDFIDLETLHQSNALFGYEGDKYYFDIDIRKHFGLDKYDGNIIPYWKTETVEAMDAFQNKPNYRTGAGECVSLAVLYAAALFIIARIPLEKIFMLATPLHSQNYVDIEDGILTNNRRLLTKQMWFNGTALSAQARRALENEHVTIVAHESGWIHTVYKEATIAPAAYNHFASKLGAFLKIELTPEIIGNFVRHRRDLQKCFYIRRPIRGIDHYITAERVFAYEQDSSFRLTDATREKLLAEIDSDEFQSQPVSGGIVLNDLEDFLRKKTIDLADQKDVALLTEKFACSCLNAKMAMEQLINFCRIVPKIPASAAKMIAPQPKDPLGLSPEMGRNELIARLKNIRSLRKETNLAFYAYRDLNMTEAGPFLLAAMERSPVSIAAAKKLKDDQISAEVEKMPDKSIYDEAARLAQPDEVWNYKRGDGLEKAILLANILHQRHPAEKITIAIAPDEAKLNLGQRTFRFPTGKKLKPQKWDLSGYHC